MAERMIPVLDIHQNARELNTTNPTGYTPTPEEKRAIKLVNRLFEKAKKHRAKYDERWMDYYKMFRGKQWKEQRPTYRHSEVINMIFQHIQSVVPILSDARQRFEFLPEEPTDLEFARILDQVAESDWVRGNWSYRLTEILYDAHFFGTGLAEICYDPKARDGLGAPDFKSVDPLYCFPDPDAFDVNERCGFFIYAEPMDIERLRKKWPDKAQWIKSDLMDLMNEDKTDITEIKYRSPVDSTVAITGQNTDIYKGQDKALEITCYIKSDEVEEIEKKTFDEATGEPRIEYEQRLKYPNGRKIVLAGSVVVFDGPNPYEDGLFPYARFVNYIDPRTFWGISEVEVLESPQKTFNKLVSFALDVLTLTGNPVWIVSTDSDVDADNLFNRPGLVIEKAPGSEVRREEGVQLQPYVLQLIDRMREWFNESGGSQDITRGVKPEGITAASAISQLQEAAQTRIRQKSRNLDACLQASGQLYKNRVLQFTTAPQIVRVTNDQAATKYFKFHVENREQPDGSIQKVGIVRDYLENPETGQMSESPQAKEFIIRGNFDVRVSTGSALPFAKDQKFNKARQMFLDGVIDEEEYLKAADYPNWEAVLQRVQEKKAQEAQAQMAAKGAPAGPPPPAA
jgi:hypothetical protein